MLPSASSFGWEHIKMPDALRVRPSTTSRWTDCARRQVAHAYPELLADAGYALRETPSSIGALVGTSVHAGGAELLKQKLQTGAIEAPSRGFEAGTAAFVEEMEKQEVAWDDVTRNPNDAARQIQRMVNTYHFGVAMNVTPVAVEQRLEATFDGVLISGQADNLCLFPSGPRDTKTGKMAGWNVPQLGCYSALARAHGNRVETCTEDFIQRVSPRVEQPPVKSKEFDRGDCEKAAAGILELMKHQIGSFEADPKKDPWAFPANPNSMLCSDKFCKAYHTKWCSAWKEKIR